MERRSRSAARKDGARRRVLVVTGSRSEYGLLRPVMEAVKRHKRLRLFVAVAGEHLLAPARTWREVAGEFQIDAKVLMQRAGDKTRADHAAACARGMEGFARTIKRLKPDWVVVLGDRIEAFAAASAASIAGVAVAHIHGGDRAEGIADEAMRHAITKMAHLHLAATKRSAERIMKMGERKEFVHIVGSPAIDGLDQIKPMSEREAMKHNRPEMVVLYHPSGLAKKQEARWLKIIMVAALPSRTLFVAPNFDPGRHAIVGVLPRPSMDWWRWVNHLPRNRFVGLLKFMAAQRSRRGVLVGNSSAGLIEAAALGVPAVNVGPRQTGRERGRNVTDVPSLPGSFVDAGRLLGDIIGKASAGSVSRSHAFGDGRSGPRIAALLAKVDPHDPGLLRKRNAY